LRRLFNYKPVTANHKPVSRNIQNFAAKTTAFLNFIIAQNPYTARLSADLNVPNFLPEKFCRLQKPSTFARLNF
jgi:hypothetical protein